MLQLTLVCCTHLVQGHTDIGGVDVTLISKEVCIAHQSVDHTNGVHLIWCALHTVVFTVYSLPSTFNCMYKLYFKSASVVVLKAWVLVMYLF